MVQGEQLVVESGRLGQKDAKRRSALNRRRRQAAIEVTRIESRSPHAFERVQVRVVDKRSVLVRIRRT